MKRADEILASCGLEKGEVDLLVLPEMCFSGRFCTWFFSSFTGLVFIVVCVLEDEGVGRRCVFCVSLVLVDPLVVRYTFIL